MQFVDFKKSLSIISPVYIICGKELYLIENVLSNLIYACDIKFPEMNITYVDSTTPLEQIFTLCETLPFCTERRLIIAKDYALGEQDSTTIKKIEEYISNANDSTCLVFTSLKSISPKNIPFVNCDTVPNNVLSSKILNDLTKKGYSIQKPALEKLIQNVDGSITYAYSELDKLIAIASQSKVIEVKDVDELSSKKSIEHTIFELTNAISKKHSSIAISLLKFLLAQDNAKGVISSLYNYFRRMFLVIACKNYTNEQIAQSLDVKPYAISIAREQAKVFGATKIMNCLAKLEDIDTRTKTSFANLEQELYTFLFYTLN